MSTDSLKAVRDGLNDAHDALASQIRALDELIEAQREPVPYLDYLPEDAPEQLFTEPGIAEDGRPCVNPYCGGHHINGPDIIPAVNR